MSSDFFKVKKGLNIKPTDPSTLGELQDGDIVIDSTAGNSMKIYSTEAGGFSEVGTGSGINYIDNNTFDGGVSGWTGDTNLVISKEDVAPLRGNGSLKIAKGAVDASTQQVYTDFTIDTADLAKKLTITFDIDASDANYSDDDMIVKIIKDPAGTPVTISVNGAEIKGGKYSYIGQFQTDATELDYRLVIEQVSTHTDAVNILIDNVKVGPREVAKGVAMTDWTDFTPTGSWTTNTTYTGKYRRVGDSAEIQYMLKLTGAPNATNLTIDLPSGLSVDENKIATNNTSLAAGIGEAKDAGTAAYHISAVYNTSLNSFQIKTYKSDVTHAQETNVSNTVPYSFTTNDSVSVTVKVPIAGWSSNSVSSEDLGGREVVVEAYGNSGGTDVITANTEDIPFNTSSIDTTASWSNAGNTGSNAADAFTAPETGYYLVTGTVRHSGSTIGTTIGAYVDGTLNKQIGYVPNTGTTHYVVPFSGTVRLNKGEVLTLRTDNTLTLVNSSTVHTIHIQKLASPQTILETETVAARYTSNNGQALGTGATIVYEDLVNDTHNAYNSSTGVYTVPVSGWYSINAKYATASRSWVAGNGIECRIHINGTLIDSGTTTVAAAVTAAFGEAVSTEVYLEKGDTVEIKSSTSGSSSLIGSSNYNTFSIARIK